jgi:hypothetical protein
MVQLAVLVVARLAGPCIGFMPRGVSFVADWFRYRCFLFRIESDLVESSVSALAGNGLKPAILGASGGKQGGFGSENYQR